MKVTTPEEMKKVANVEKILAAFEEKFKKEDPGQERYHLVVSGELSKEEKAAVVEAYTKAGWKNVECRTSSENGERPGLTGLKICMP